MHHVKINSNCIPSNISLIDIGPVCTWQNFKLTLKEILKRSLNSDEVSRGRCFSALTCLKSIIKGTGNRELEFQPIRNCVFHNTWFLISYNSYSSLFSVLYSFYCVELLLILYTTPISHATYDTRSRMFMYFRITNSSQ